MISIKTTLLVLSLLIFLSGISIAHVGLDYPTGGENFTAGSNVTIEWHIEIDHGSCDWDLYFSSNGGTNWEEIVADLPKTQLTYDWTVPNVGTSLGRIMVVQDNLIGTNYDARSGYFIISDVSGIRADKNQVEDFKLFQAYPNPFNPSTKIKYALNKNSRVRISVFNLIGEKVATLVDEEKSPGVYEVNFDASDLPTGTYLYQLHANDLSAGKAGFISTKKMILLK